MIYKHSGTDAQISKLTRVHNPEVDKHRKLSCTLPTRWNNAHGTVMQGFLCFTSRLAILTFHVKHPASWVNWIKKSYWNILLKYVSWVKKKSEESLRQLGHFHDIFTRRLICLHYQHSSLACLYCSYTYHIHLSCNVDVQSHCLLINLCFLLLGIC